MSTWLTARETFDEGRARMRKPAATTTNDDRGLGLLKLAIDGMSEAKIRIARVLSRKEMNARYDRWSSVGSHGTP